MDRFERDVRISAGSGAFLYRLIKSCHLAKRGFKLFYGREC